MAPHASVQAHQPSPSVPPPQGKGGKKAEKKVVSLLDDMVEDLLELPEYTALSVKAVDDQGAQVRPCLGPVEALSSPDLAPI